MFLHIGKNIIMGITLKPLNMIMCWGSLWSELLKLLPKATQPVSGRESCFILKLFSHVHLLSDGHWKRVGLTGRLSAHLRQMQSPSLPSYLCIVPSTWNVLSSSIAGYQDAVCILVFFFFFWRGICPLTCQSGCFTSSLHWPPFFRLYQGSSFFMREPWFINFTKPLPPALISHWNGLFCDTLFPLSMHLTLSVLQRARPAHT